MTDIREYIGFGDVERFLVKSYKCVTGGREFDIDKYGPYIDAVRRILVLSLEKQIMFFLERFVYNENSQLSSYEPYFNSYKHSMLTAYAKYNEIGNSIEVMRDSLTLDYLVDFFGHSLLTNTRLTKLGDDLTAMGIEKNFLGYVNVLNYMNEKDFWVCSSSSSNISRQYASICSDSSDKVASDINAEQDTHVVVCSRGHKRTRKRGATHISRKHYKLERLAQLSERSFKVTESLCNLLKNSWDLHDSVHVKRRVKRNCDNLRQSSLADYRRSNQQTDWKNASLAFIVKKLNRPGTKHEEGKGGGNSEVRTSLTLPCKVEQLICKLEGIDSSVQNSPCSSVKKRFQAKLYNVCSCLNNLLGKMNGKVINSVYLICEIRKHYLNFKLRQSLASKCNSNLFAARVMTCEGLRNRFETRKNDLRQKSINRNSRISKTTNPVENGNENSADNKAISAIEISFTMCEDGGANQQHREKGLTCDPEDLEGLTLRDSSSINDVVQKLQLSPFRLEETEQSFRIRSKIQDIVRSIIICTQDNSSSPPARVEGQCISIQATISSSSFRGIKHDADSTPETKSSKTSSVRKTVSKMIPRKSADNASCSESVKPENFAEVLNKFARSKNCSEAQKQEVKSRQSERRNKSPQKFSAFYSPRESPKLMNKNQNKMCTSSEKPASRSEEFTRSHRRRAFSKNMLESIACEISNALARTKSTGSSVLAEDENDFDIDVTVEIEDSSSVSSDSISRHTHVLPSMKSVKLGTCKKYFAKNYPQLSSLSSSSSSSSSLSEIRMHDKFTTMNKSMISSGRGSTTSGMSYDRMKHLIREKVCKKLSAGGGCRPDSAKTVVTSAKYYLSIPSSKANGERREVSESSSTSRGSLNNRQMEEKTLSSDEDSVSVKSSDCCYTDSDNNTESSRAATFDKNSTYGCIDDRLANRHLSDIVDDYADETEDSPRCNYDESRIIFYEPFSDDQTEPTSYEYVDCEISSEDSRSIICQVYTTDDDDEHADVTRFRGRKFLTTSCVMGGGTVQETPGLNEHKKFDNIDCIRRVANGWSTCAVRSSSSIDCRDIYRAKSNDGMVIEDRGDSPRQDKSLKFDTLNFIEKYKKRLKTMDRNLRAKLQEYVDFCKIAKNNLQRHICLADVCEASKTSIPSNRFKRHKCSGTQFTG